ncbi:bestrophin family protein [Paraburkholderia phosphatilytica]|uniref:bestrophin family protein n=1 Tax=Paraburkholderia phosphatilytica TaxID=2282883 RepID=UPI000E54319B|nr:bestrophin family ion channel [Paraburkholderia phosphatilytica]
MILPGRVRLAQVLVYVGRPLAYLFIWDVIVTIAWLGPLGYRVRFPTLPLPLLGSAIVIYLTFRNSSAYARWWEARTLWGAFINQSRSFARELQMMLPKDGSNLCRRLTLRQIAYAHALRLHLRRQPPWETLAVYLAPDECERLKTVANVPNAILLGSAALLRDEARLDNIQIAALEHTLRELTNAQGGMERIRNTPFPQQYASYPAIFTHVFCILLPVGLVDTLGIFTPLGSTVVGFLFLALLQIGNDMEHPFDNTVNDVPMSALTRVIEIDLRDGLSDAHELKPMQPEKGVLW